MTVVVVEEAGVFVLGFGAEAVAVGGGVGAGGSGELAEGGVVVGGGGREGGGVEEFAKVAVAVVAGLVGGVGGNVSHRNQSAAVAYSIQDSKP